MQLDYSFVETGLLDYGADHFCRLSGVASLAVQVFWFLPYGDAAERREEKILLKFSGLL